MKRITCLLSLALALMLLLAAAAHADTGVVVGLSLEKIGEYPAPATDELPEDDRSIWEKATTVKASGIQYLDDGIYAVAGRADSVNCFGLFTEDGEQLLPYEAALIQRLNARYLPVYYATEETTDKKEALLYIPSDNFWLSQNIMRDGDTMFKGYAKFFDTTLKRFVGDLTKDDYYASSGRLLVFRGSGEKTGIYDETGAKVSDTPMKAGNGFLSTGGEVYDEDLNLRYTSDTNLSIFPSDGPYLSKTLESGGCQVIDIDGGVILPGPFKHVDRETGGVFYVRREDESYALIGLDNTVIAASQKQFSVPAPGYWCSQDENGYFLVGPNGIIAIGLEKAPNVDTLNVSKTQPDGGHYMLVLNSGDWMPVPFDWAYSLIPGLAYQSFSEDGKPVKGVYNLYAGELLLKADYDRIYTIGNFLVAQLGDVCEVYRIRCEYK